MSEASVRCKSDVSIRSYCQCQNSVSDAHARCKCYKPLSVSEASARFKSDLSVRSYCQCQKLVSDVGVRCKC